MTANAEGILVRWMREADIERVMSIAAGLKDAPHWTRAAYVSALDPGGSLRRIALVAEAEAVAGFLIAGVVAPQAELESIAVSAEEQRRGIGRELIAAAIAELRAAEVHEVFLEVRASNRTALGFYRSLGWRETGRRSRYYADPEEDAVLMIQALE